ncbi:cell division protein BlhA [Acinetobacter bereziniae]|uniref:cell division protein BlhA n=1 Tax=Acinetobacter bereziniae TaxID=106648 RepID=UPI00300B65BA
MTLNVGQDFKKRWLDTPEAVRQTFVDDLNRICDLLSPKTDVQQWLSNDQREMQVAQLKVEQAYADLKAQLIEEARVRKQLALEKALAEKRAQQDAYNLELQKDETQQYEQQTLNLQNLRQQIDLEISIYSEKYTKNPDTPAIDYANGQSAVADAQITSELESVRLRLELEAETLIEQAVDAFRSKLQTAAKDEIEYILANSNFSAEK